MPKPETTSTLNFHFAQWGEAGDYTPVSGPLVPVPAGFIVDVASAPRPGTAGFEGHTDERIYTLRMRTDLITPEQGATVTITEPGSEHIGKNFRLESLVEDDSIAPEWTVIRLP